MNTPDVVFWVMVCAVAQVVGSTPIMMICAMHWVDLMETGSD